MPGSHHSFNTDTTGAAWLIRSIVRCRLISMERSDNEKRVYSLSRGINPLHHCCVDMAFYIAHPIEIPHQGRNRVIDWIASWDEYRIPVAYDGYSSTPIRHCPWCGKRLPDSKQELWYQTLYKLGYSDPVNDKIPKEFNSDRWWRKLKT